MIKTDLVFVEDNKISIDYKNLELGKFYPIVFDGIDYFVQKPKEGVIDLYELGSYI